MVNFRWGQWVRKRKLGGVRQRLQKRFGGIRREGTGANLKVIPNKGVKKGTNQPKEQTLNTHRAVVGKPGDHHGNESEDSHGEAKVADDLDHVIELFLKGRFAGLHGGVSHDCSLNGPDSDGCDDHVGSAGGNGGAGEKERTGDVLGHGVALAGDGGLVGLERVA